MDAGFNSAYDYARALVYGRGASPDATHGTWNPTSFVDASGNYNAEEFLRQVSWTIADLRSEDQEYYLSISSEGLTANVQYSFQQVIIHAMGPTGNEGLVDLVPLYKKLFIPFGDVTQSSGDVNWNGVNTGLKVAEGFGVGAAAGREIALDYRMSKPLMNRVGMSANVKAISRLGTASKYLGAAGYGAAIVGTGLDINAYRNGQLSGARLSYNTLGTAVGIGVGIGVGAVPGAAAGGAFYAGQQLYDGYNWWVGQMSIYLTDFENGLKSGWFPGR